MRGVASKTTRVQRQERKARGTEAGGGGRQPGGAESRGHYVRFCVGRYLCPFLGLCSTRGASGSIALYLVLMVLRQVSLRITEVESMASRHRRGPRVDVAELIDWIFKHRRGPWTDVTGPSGSTNPRRPCSPARSHFYRHVQRGDKRNEELDPVAAPHLLLELGNCRSLRNSPKGSFSLLSLSLPRFALLSHGD
ncbi:hypothetical protein B296_00006890 [Ensete ventricosum]|uniref:Uncharacterized protein n=1 Tax=Ensete ventricosum TaxID=4639 RepID=A0A427B923_ENSVE|nr:hypothetical protein B296_00006890 [Ensete ventricosum]